MIEKLKNKKTIFIIVIAVIIIISIFAIFNVKDDNRISKVKKILGNKYYDIYCLDSNCNGIVAAKGEKLKESTVELLNGEGKKVAKYKTTYNSKEKITKEPYQIANNYFIMKKINNKESKIIGYTINNKDGKELYSTNNELIKLNDNYLIMIENKEYTILNKKGEEIYSNIKEYKTYNDNKIISVNIDGTYVLLDSNLEQIISDHKVAKEIKNMDNTLYLIVKNIKDGLYYYYDISKNVIKGDGFENYIVSDTEEKYIVTKTENTRKIKYELDKNGKQTKINNDYTQVELVNKIKEKIDTNKYYVYTISVINNNQNKVLVDDKINKKFGLYNLKNGKFEELYSYLNKENTYSTVSKIKSNDNEYFQITCDNLNCDKSKLYVYNLNKSKTLYNFEGEDKIAQDYIQYEDGYKVIKYSKASSNVEYKGKYVLYNKKNKELHKSNNEISVIDKNVIFGNTNIESLIFYSVKENKILNTEEKLGSIINILEEKFYKYSDKNNELIVLNDKGNQVIKTKNQQYLNYDNTSIIYLDGNKVKMYDVKSNKTKKYKLKENEKLNDVLGDIIPPYKGAIFVNNIKDNYFKVIGTNGKKIKIIKNSELNLIKYNNNKNNIFIITKKSTKKGNLYGLYLAK